MNSAKIYLIGTGMLTAIGSNTPSTYAAVCAGLNAYVASSHLNKYRKPMKFTSVPASALPPLDAKLVNYDRFTKRDKHLIRLAHPALLECLSSFRIPAPVPVILAGHEKLPTSPKPVSPVFLDGLMAQTGITFDKLNSRYLSMGRAGGIHAIYMASKFLASTQRDFVLIGGLETQVGAQNSLAMLDKEDRILAEGVFNGYVPGEAAGFMLLASEAACSKYQLEPVLSMHRPGLGEEAGNVYSEEPYKGEGLSDAFKQAVNTKECNAIKSIYSSQNGESYWAKEFGVATMRSKVAFSDDCIHNHPADSIGDIGPAFGPVLLGLASLDKKKPCLIYCSSDGPSRAAVYVE